MDFSNFNGTENLLRTKRTGDKKDFVLFALRETSESDSCAKFHPRFPPFFLCCSEESHFVNFELVHLFFGRDFDKLRSYFFIKIFGKNRSIRNAYR